MGHYWTQFGGAKMNDANKEFGRLLAKYRKEAGLTQRELGERCGFGEHAQPRIGGYELGRRAIKLDTLLNLARQLGIPVVYLIPGAWSELLNHGLVVENPENQNRVIVQGLFDSLSPKSQRVLIAAARAMAD